MATSSSYDWSLNRNQIITEALDIIGEYSPGESITADDVSTCSRSLNAMVKAWQTKGIGLWMIQEVVSILQADQVEYSIGPSAGRVTTSSDYAKTELAAALAASGTSMTVDSITGFADADVIGVETSNSDIHWDVINGDPSSTTITLTTGVDYACVVDAHVYAYTNRCQRPLEIIEARIRDNSGIDIPVEIVSRDEYMKLSNKTTEARPNLLYYDAQLTNGKFFVWPEPSDMKETLWMTIKRPVEDFDAAANDCDFPPEWIECLSWNLARRIAPKFGHEVSKDVMAMAQETFQDAKGFDRENVSIQFVPAYRGRR